MSQRDIKPEVASPMHAVGAWKQGAFVRMQAAIIRRAMAASHVSPGDVAEDTVADEDRQGVASNAWNSLVALGVLERLPRTATFPAYEIYGGRTRNKNPGAKGRWTAVYRLTSPGLARSWMARHGQPLEPQRVPVQQELL